MEYLGQDPWFVELRGSPIVCLFVLLERLFPLSAAGKVVSDFVWKSSAQQSQGKIPCLLETLLEELQRQESYSWGAM